MANDGKVFNRSIRLSKGCSIYVNDVEVIDGNGNVDAPITTTNLTTTGNTTLGDAVTDTTSINGATTITSTGASALAVGRQGSTSPVLKVDASASSVATWISVTGAAAASGVALAAISSGTNENLTVDAKGSGTVTINGTGTGNVVLGRAATGVSLAVTAGLTSSGATGSGIGYATGAGGAVTQTSSRTTGVTLNTLCGAITLVSAAGSATPATFTVTNSTVAATDTIHIHQKSGTDLYQVLVTAVGAGSFNVTFFTTGWTTTEQPVFNFSVMKAVAA